MTSIVSEPVSVVRERLMCDCGGEMVATGGGALLTSPPRYPHECNKCGAHEYVRGASFPRIRYVAEGPARP